MRLLTSFTSFAEQEEEIREGRESFAKEGA